MTPVRLSRAALRDFHDIQERLLAEAGLPVAQRFAQSLERAGRQLASFPESGARLDLRGLNIRRIGLRGFPHAAFYRFDGRPVLILRLLHSARDIPATLRVP